MHNWIVNKLFPIFIGVSGCFCVLFGAWLAHAGLNLPEALNNRLTTAHHYQIIHTLALLGVFVWIQVKSQKILYASAWLLIIGTICFSGSLYLKTLLTLSNIGNITPFGGVILALAWFLLAFSGFSYKGVVSEGLKT